MLCTRLLLADMRATAHHVLLFATIPPSKSPPLRPVPGKYPLSASVWRLLAEMSVSVIALSRRDALLAALAPCLPQPLPDAARTRRSREMTPSYRKSPDITDKHEYRSFDEQRQSTMLFAMQDGQASLDLRSFDLKVHGSDGPLNASSIKPDSAQEATSLTGTTRPWRLLPRVCLNVKR